MELRWGRGHRDARKYNEAEIGNEMSVETKTTETRCNRSVAKKRNDGETTRSEAENCSV